MVQSLHFVQYTPLYPKPLPPRLNPALGAITRLRSVLRFDCETRCSCRPRKVPTVSNQSTENISNFKIDLKTNLTLLFQNHVFIIVTRNRLNIKFLQHVTISKIAKRIIIDQNRINPIFAIFNSKMTRALPTYFL